MEARRLDIHSLDGTHVAVWVQGTGPAIVMVHGSIADHTTFDPLVTVLGEHMTTYSMDRRGFGASGDTPDYSIERDFDDVAAVVDAVADRTGGPVTLLGHSYGANCAMGGAARSDNVERLVLYEPSLGIPYPSGSIARVEAALERGDHEAAIVAVLTDILQTTDDEIEVFRASPMWPARLAAAPTIPRECHAEEDWVYRPREFDTITAPTLLLAGSDSVPVITDATTLAAGAIPHAEIHVLEGHGHFAHRTDPDLVTKIIVDFATSRTSRPSPSASTRDDAVTTANVNGVELYFDTVGAGERLILTHGSWTDGSGWAPSVPNLAARYEVVTWDRRGHSRSQHGSGPGSRAEDTADLIGLIEHLDGGRVHLVGNSYGAIVALTVVTDRPDLVASAAVHEPPLFGLLEGTADPRVAEALLALQQRLQSVAALIEAGEHRAAAELFFDRVALGPGSWAQMPEPFRGLVASNAGTFLDELHDPTALTIDTSALAATTVPLQLTYGTASPTLFPAVIDQLASLVPTARVTVLDGVGHIPHASHPDQWTATLLAFLDRVDHHAGGGPR